MTSKAITTRPTQLTPAIAQEICDRVGFGQSLRKICRDPAMPWELDVRRWLDEDRAFAKQYDDALRYYADGQFDELQELAEEATSSNLNLAKFKSETLKWRLAKLDPERFGDRTDLTVTARRSVEHEITVIEEHFVDASGQVIKTTSHDLIANVITHQNLRPQCADDTLDADVVDAEVTPYEPQGADRSQGRSAESSPVEPPPPAEQPTGPGINRAALHNLFRRPPWSFW